MELLYKFKGTEYSYDWNHQKISVLKGISLEIEQGAFTCLVGPSGVGKTTLLNIMGLIETPTKGEFTFCNESISNKTENALETLRLKKIGFVFQSFYLIPTLSVLENASYFLPLIAHPNPKNWTMEILDLLGLADQSHKRPLELSGGQRQRVAIARALVKKPQVILADEPTANLDSVTAEKIILAFKEIQRAENTSFIFATHDSHLVGHAKKVLKMNDGLIYE